MLVIENIKEVKNDLIEMGFKPKTFREWGKDEEYLIWHEDKTAKGNRAPDLKISCDTGDIFMPMTSTYYQKGIPSVVKDIITNSKFKVRG